MVENYSLKDLKIMTLRNILTPSIFLFALVVVGCTNKKETVECDQTKFDCTLNRTGFVGESIF